MGIKDHIFYERLRSVPAKEAASWIIGDAQIQDVTATLRKQAFRRVGKNIIAHRKERQKYGYTYDSAGDIAKAMEWAFKAGQKTRKS